jgi:hypothetical protein
MGSFYEVVIADPQWPGIYSGRLNGILDRTIHNICLQIGPDKRACVNLSGHFPVSRQPASWDFPNQPKPYCEQW